VSPLIHDQAAAGRLLPELNVVVATTGRFAVVLLPEMEKFVAQSTQYVNCSALQFSTVKGDVVLCSEISAL
jgi:hypothetical protein